MREQLLFIVRHFFGSKFKLSFDDEEDDSRSDSDKNESLDFKKEIREYIKLSVHEQNF